MRHLRDYQLEMLSKLEKAWKKHRSVMIQMPTGTGKTHLIAEVIRQQKGKGEVLVVAHRRELLDQIRGTIAAFGIDQEENRIVVESIQKLSRKSPTLTPTLVIVDEAHHALAKTYKQLWEWWPKAKFLGLTATPCRLSGETFTDLFDILLQSYSIQKFIDDGWLSDFEYISAAPGSLMAKKVRLLKKRSAGDYQETEMATVLDVPESIQHLYDTYERFAKGKKGIVYAINRAHAQHITEYYQQQGVCCAVIDGKTPSEERKRLVADYLEGTISVLVSIDCFSEGFDAPEVEVIQLARPTLSLSKYLQQVGRGMRVSPGKPHVLILDNVGLYQTFGLPTEERNWQKMFLGMLSGKGHEGRIVLVDDASEQTNKEKELVNLQMVRVKKGGRKGAGLEIFLQGGLYGIMLNGKVTCPAKFKEIVRIGQKSQFFAIGAFTETQNTANSHLYMPYKYTMDVFTVINKKGQDMNARFYGNTYQIFDDFVCGLRYNDSDLLPSWWDSKTGNYYNFDKIRLRTIHGMEFVCEGWSGCFRFVTGSVNPYFSLPTLYYNRYIALNKDFLIVKSDHNHAYKIIGYLDDGIIVQNDKRYGYLHIHKDGTMGENFLRQPTGMKIVPDYNLLGVKPIGSKPLQEHDI